MIASIILYLALGLFIYLSYRRMLNGILIIVAFLPVYLWRFNIFGLPTTFLELMILSLFCIWLIKAGQYKKINWTLKKAAINPLPITLRWFLSGWLVVSLVAVAVNPTWSALGLWRAYFLEPLMFFLVFVYTVKDKNDLRKILWAMAVLIIWLFFLALYQNFSTWNYIAAYNYPHIKRLTSVFSYPNALSLPTAPLAVLLLVYSLTHIKDKNNYLFLLVGVLGLSLSFLAVSQGAIIAFFLAVIFWLILAKKTRKWTLIILSFFIISSFFLEPLKNYLTIWQQEIFQPQLDLKASSLEIRSSQWQETVAMLKGRPILGAGLNAYQKAVAPYHHYDWLEIYLYPHNIFLNFWSELGIFGLLIFLLIMGYVIFILRKLFLAKNSWAIPLILTWFVWFVHGLVDVPYFKNDLSVLFFIMLGLTIISSNYVNQKDFDLHLH